MSYHLHFFLTFCDLSNVFRSNSLPTHIDDSFIVIFNTITCCHRFGNLIEMICFNFYKMEQNLIQGITSFSALHFFLMSFCQQAKVSECHIFDTKQYRYNNFVRILDEKQIAWSIRSRCL